MQVSDNAYSCQFHPEVCAGILNEEEPIVRVVIKQENASNGRGIIAFIKLPAL